MKRNYFQVLAKLIFVYLFVGFCIASERSDNATSIRDKAWTGKTTDRSDNTTSVKDKDKGCIGNTTNRGNNTTSVKSKECVLSNTTDRVGNTTDRGNNTTDTSAKDKEWIENSTKMFEKMIDNYDTSIAPFVPGKPVNVSFIIEVLAFGEIDEANMEYGLDLFVIQVWKDIRLAQGQDRTFSFGGDDIKKIWTPDTYFMNSKESGIKNVMKNNHMVHVMKDGQVVQISRVTLKVACHMQLQMYPLDRQKCDLVIESFSLSQFKLVYHWGNLIADECIVQVFDDAMAQYEYKGVKLNYRHEKISSGSFSNLYATFVFDRRTSYTVLQVFLPSYMIVILSFMALWLPQDAVPARIALGITTVLTIVYFLGTVNSSMPRLSYMKAIDCHLFVSFGFVFATMLEYVILLNVKDRKKRTPTRHEDCELYPLTSHIPEESSQGYNYNDDVVVRYRMGNCQNHTDNGTITVLPHKKESHDIAPLHSIDRFARVLFPASYGVFVAVYWVVCAVLSPQREELDLC